MVFSWMLLLCVAAPAPVATQDTFDVGPFRIQQVHRLSWPGLHAPDFALIRERRWVHRFTLGFNRGLLERFDASLVGVEPTYDPDARQRTLHVLSPEGRGNVWAGVRVRLPGNDLRLSIGRAFSVDTKMAPVAAGVRKISLTGRF